MSFRGSSGFHLQTRDRLTDFKNKLRVTTGERRGGRLNQEFGINRYTLYIYVYLLYKTDDQHNTYEINNQQGPTV